MDESTPRPGEGEETQDDIVFDALKRCKKEIIATDDFTPEEALRLGGSYLAYSADRALLAADEADNTPESRAFHMRRRMGLEAALAKAQSGDYTGIKDELVQEGEGNRGWADQLNILVLAALSLPGETMETIEPFRKFAKGEQKLVKNFLKMATALPDQGEPYVPPLPQPLE